MKMVTVSSVALIVTGTLFALVALQLPLGTVLPVIFTSLGFFLILAGMLTIVGTIVAIMFPYVSHRLDHCQH